MDEFLKSAIKITNEANKTKRIATTRVADQDKDFLDKELIQIKNSILECANNGIYFMLYRLPNQSTVDRFGNDLLEELYSRLVQLGFYVIKNKYNQYIESLHINWNFSLVFDEQERQNLGIEIIDDIFTKQDLDNLSKFGKSILDTSENVLLAKSQKEADSIWNIIGMILDGIKNAASLLEREYVYESQINSYDLYDAQWDKVINAIKQTGLNVTMQQITQTKFDKDINIVDGLIEPNIRRIVVSW